MPGVVTAGRLVDDRYRLLEPLEEGGMGIRWRAEDLISERIVTVKELRFPDPLDHMQRRALAARVRREARAMAAVEHPGLARIVDVVDDGDRPWVVSEMIDAPTLGELVQRDGPLDPEPAALLGLRLLAVLEAATDQDMVHRFLQPSKVFVDASGDVRLADFGIASLIGDPAVARDGAVGGVSFMSPEQAGTQEADIWSLGAVLYYAVEGVPPFPGKNATAILEAVASDPPRPAESAGPLARVLEVTLQKDPSERPSADELRTLLEVAAGPLAPRAEEEAPEKDTILWADPEPEPERPMVVDLHLVGDEDQAVTEAANGQVNSEEPAEEQPPAPPPPPLPPKVALARMFSPDPGAAPMVFTPEEEHSEPAPPWPVPRRRSMWTLGICAVVVLAFLVILFTNGREIFTREGRSARIVSSVDWAEYVDPDTGFTIDYPEDWRVTRDGPYTDFRHPDAAAALRVVVQDANGRTAQNGWIELERRFRTSEPTYSRIRLEPVEFRGFDASEWEFTYSKSNVPLHNLDLGVVTGAKGFTLNFESRESNWSIVKAFFERFQRSFRPPAT
jgi:serine/threonine protein kinase